MRDRDRAAPPVRPPRQEPEPRRGHEAGLPGAAAVLQPAVAEGGAGDRVRGDPAHGHGGRGGAVEVRVKQK